MLHLNHKYNLRMKNQFKIIELSNHQVMISKNWDNDKEIHTIDIVFFIGNYISNAQRPEMIKVLRETADRLEKNQDFKTPDNNMY